MADTPATTDLEKWLQTAHDLPGKVMGGLRSAMTPADPGADEAGRKYMDAATPAAAPAGGSQPVADDKEKWASDAFKKSHKGRLHRRLGVDENKPIPADKLKEALAGKHGPEVQHMAQADHNINQ